MMNILTQHINPPIPTSIRWEAWIDGNEELGSGFGITEKDAINNLTERLNWIDSNENDETNTR